MKKTIYFLFAILFLLFTFIEINRLSKLERFFNLGDHGVTFWLQDENDLISFRVSANLMDKKYESSRGYIVTNYITKHSNCSHVTKLCGFTIFISTPFWSKQLALGSEGYSSFNTYLLRVTVLFLIFVVCRLRNFLNLKE